MGNDNMHMAVEVVNMNIAMDDDDMLADDMHAEAVEKYHTPEDYAERLEAQGRKRDKQVRRDSLAKMTKRWNKMLQKRRTVCMRKERRMSAEITMTEQDNEIMGVMETLIYGAEETFQEAEEMTMCFDMMLREVVDEIVVDVMLNEILNIQEESWTTVQRRSKGKAKRERTGLFRNNGSEI